VAVHRALAREPVHVEPAEEVFGVDVALVRGRYGCGTTSTAKAKSDAAMARRRMSVTLGREFSDAVRRS